MKFNKLAVIGNPPYNVLPDGDANVKRTKTVYNLFIEAIIDNMKPRYLTFIVPSRWMVGGRGLNNFRKRMKKDRCIKLLKHFNKKGDVFKDVNIAGGVCYFLRDSEYSGNCRFFDGETLAERDLREYDIIINNNRAISILEKVLNYENNS